MKILKQILALLLLLQIQAMANNDLEMIAKCDVNGNGKIDTRRDYKAGRVAKDIAKKESSCKREFELEKSKKEREKVENDLKKILKIK
ncbi:hypothetical protein C9926_03020 [Sulfurovum lithotrophicum]|nr:hypothetical protein C9926_03020 [Sulfurovum lithotrophicum]